MGAVSPAWSGGGCGVWNPPLSRNAALNGHNRCRCAASARRDPAGRPRASNNAQLGSPPSGCSRSPLFSSFLSPLQSALQSSTRGLQPAPRLFLQKNDSFRSKKKKKKGQTGGLGSSKPTSSLTRWSRLFRCVLPSPVPCRVCIPPCGFCAPCVLRAGEGAAGGALARSGLPARDSSHCCFIFTS